MKKLRYSMLLFFAVAIFIAAGLCSQTLYTDTKQAAATLVRQGNIDGFIEQVDAASQKLRYKNTLIDLYSLWYRLTDTRRVEKTDATVVRLDNDFLAFEPNIADAGTLAEMASACAELKAVTEEVGGDFLYVAAPNKLSLSNGGDNAVCENIRALETALKAQSVPVLNLMDSMCQQGLTMEECYFHTDHHWLPQTGLWAAGEILRTLPGCDYEESIMELDHYEQQTWPDLFLGSEGKKVGRYFTPLGLDDFTVLNPVFSTELTVKDRLGTRSGNFSETLLFESYLSFDDIYLSTPYTTYTGGDFPLQVIENQLRPDGKTILVVRDSYAGVMTPFLSLNAGQVHTIDVRYWKGVDGAETVEDYVRLIRPDYVVVMYAGVSPHMFAFSEIQEK